MQAEGIGRGARKGMVKMTATQNETTVKYERTYTECADPTYGGIHYTYRESVLGLGSPAYTEVQDYFLANGETSHYQHDIIQLRSGQWVSATTNRDFGSTEYRDETELIDADQAWAWINGMRAQHVSA